MVEGHSVHRIASRFRLQLVGKKFTASSPNGRFTEGATEIDGKVLSRMEAVGKNLFAFFSDGKGTNGEEDDAVVGKICFLQYMIFCAHMFLLHMICFMPTKYDMLCTLHVNTHMIC